MEHVSAIGGSNSAQITPLKRPRHIPTNGVFIKGIAGLALHLQCSTASAARLKQHIPHLQIGKTIFFKREDVQKAFNHSQTELV